MTSTGALRIASRNLIRYSRRYLFLVIAVGFGFAAITVMTSVRDGMRANVERAAQNHYSGHLFVLGFDKDADTMGVVDDDRLVTEAVAAAGLEPVRAVRRTVSHLKASLVFQGRSVVQKDLFGVDFDNESELFAALNYASGGFSADMPEDSIIVSAATADDLGVRVGDRVTIQAPTRNLQTNTGDFRVAAIVDDRTILGSYTAYVRRTAMNRLLGLTDDAYSTLGLYFDDWHAGRAAADALYGELASRLPVSAPIDRKEDLTLALSRQWDGVEYLTFSLDVYISQIADLLDAMSMFSYALYGMILLVVVSGAVVTYRLVIQERSEETAALRAIGMQRRDVRRVLFAEGFLVSIVAAAAGVALAVGINALLGLASFDGIPGFDLFLRGGRLTALYRPTVVGANYVVFLVALLPVVAAHAAIASHAPIAERLVGDGQ